MWSSACAALAYARSTPISPTRRPLVAERAAAVLGVPFSFSAHARDVRKVPRGELTRRARAAACVVACNTDVADDLGATGARVELIPHGVDLRRFAPTLPPGGEPLELLAVGRLVEKKGLEALLEAVAGLEVPFRLRIVGDGPLRGALERSIADAGLHDRVTLDGTLTHRELPDAYAGANVVVVPSIQDAGGDRDGLPNVVLEAMASARPVVASEVAAIPAAVRDGDTGLLVPPGDPRALRAALERLATRSGAARGDGRRRAQARRARLRARALHSTGCSIASGTRMPDHARAPVHPSVAYVLKAFPRLSETYINSEIHRLEQAGLPLRLYATKPPEPLETGPHQPVVDRIRAAAGLPPRSDQRLRRVADHVASAQPQAVPRPTGAHREAPPRWGWRARPRRLSPKPCVRGRAACRRRGRSMSRSSFRRSRLPTSCGRRGTCDICTRTTRTGRRPWRGSPR